MSPITRSMKITKYLFPEDIWNIIKEYNGIIGWEKSIVDFLNKPSYKDLDEILGRVDLLGRDNLLFYLAKIPFCKSIRHRRKILIQSFFKTRPSNQTILELYKKYLDGLLSSTFRVGDNIRFWNGPTATTIQATVIKINRVSMCVELGDGPVREVRKITKYQCPVVEPVDSWELARMITFSHF